MSTTFKYTVLVTLAGCAHTPEYDWQYRPLEGDRLLCRRCNAYRTATGLIEQYTVRCNGCRYIRRRGQAKLSAEIDASKHHLKNPDHEVVLYLGRKAQHTWKKQAEKLDQSFTDHPLPDVPF